MTKQYLAFDFGAESGRTILGSLQDRKVMLDEITRFPTGMLLVNDHFKWNVYRLYEEIIRGITLSIQDFKANPSSLGIDTWGVDFGLFSSDGSLLDLPFCYRDSRTDGMMKEFFSRIPQKRVYELTGIQFMQLNSLYQLFSLVHNRSPLLKVAASLLFIPDIFNYFLTGRMKTEYSFATTSQLFNPVKMKWEEEFFHVMDLPLSLMQDVVQPGTVLGNVNPFIASKVGYTELKVVAVASHDTGSAIAAIPAEGENWAYISSGTWSLMGIESLVPLISQQTLDYNLTNEGGVSKTFRVLKNIMGLWLLQQSRAAWQSEKYSYSELVEMAALAPSCTSFIDPDDPVFFNPADMPGAILEFCRKTGQAPPSGIAGIVRVILESLAMKYRYTLNQLRKVSPHPIERIYIIGGGVNNELLCQFTANACGIPVITGPSEGTALGNILVQALAMGELASLTEIREVVRNSFPSKTYQPENNTIWKDAFNRFEKIVDQSHEINLLK